MDTTFPHQYEYEPQTEGPGFPSSCHYFYPGGSTSGGRDGILVRIRPDCGEPWIATFAFGEIAPNGPSGIFTTPDPNRLCVVARGEGYFVSTNDPSSWESIDVLPITDLRLIRNHEIIVFVDFTRMVAYGKDGMKWASKRLAWDDLKITEVAETVIKCESWNPSSDQTEKFIVDLETGDSNSLF